MLATCRVWCLWLVSFGRLIVVRFAGLRERHCMNDHWRLCGLFQVAGHDTQSFAVGEK